MPRNTIICSFMVIIFMIAVSTALFPLPQGNAQLRNLYGTNINGTSSPSVNGLGTVIPGSGSSSSSGFSPYGFSGYYNPLLYSLLDSLITPPGLLFAPPAVPGLGQIAGSRGVVRSSQQNLSGTSQQGISGQQTASPLLATISSSVGTDGLYYFPQDYLSLQNAGAVGLLTIAGLSAVSRVTSLNFPYLPYQSQMPGSFPSVNSGAFANAGRYAANAFFGPFTSFFTGSQALQLPLQPYAAMNGGLISWPRAEVVIPAASPVVPINYTYTVVNVFPHDRTAFTQGLVYNGGFLYEGTGIVGRSQIRKVDLLTGAVLQSRDLPSPYFGEGITIFTGRIIQLTWLHNIGFVYDKLTFDLLQSFTYPTEGWGLTHNGINLIMSDGTSTLHFLDPVTFAEVGSIDVYDQDGPVTRLNELEYIKGEIYANVWLTNRVVRISPITGQVVGSINLAGLLSPADIVFPIDVLNGIAYDAKNNRLFVTGKLWPKLFEIELVPLP